jgi:hypothetical protein
MRISCNFGRSIEGHTKTMCLTFSSDIFLVRIQFQNPEIISCHIVKLRWENFLSIINPFSAHDAGLETPDLGRNISPGSVRAAMQHQADWHL